MNSSTQSSPRVYVIGAGSRLFKSLNLGIEFTPVSGRQADLGAMPPYPDGSQILVFADPPDLHQTQAMLLSLLHQVAQGSGCRIIYISSIAAAFGQSTEFAYEGPYAHKKRMAESMLHSRVDLDVCIVRVGNVFDHGGWQAVRERTRWIWLPVGYARTAVSDQRMVRAAIENVLRAASGHHVLNAWKSEPTAGIFRQVVGVPGLLSLYRLGWARLPVKLMGRGLGLLKVYLPSHDDLNSFLAK